MALGDYTKTGYNNGTAPPISAPNLNNNEDKTKELDTELTAHEADNANPHTVTASQAGAEPIFSKNNAFNKNFGATAGTVTQGNDSRLLPDVPVGANIYGKVGEWELTGIAGTVISSFASPSTYPRGLAFDGTYLWNADASPGMIYKLNASGTVIASFSSPSTYPRGLAFDGTYLWNADSNTDIIYKLNTSGTVIFSFLSPSTGPAGLTWDGTYLLNADENKDRIYKLNTSGTVIFSFLSPSIGPTGLTWDGTYLWNADEDADRIYKLRIEHSYILVA